MEKVLIKISYRTGSHSPVFWGGKDWHVKQTLALKMLHSQAEKFLKSLKVNSKKFVAEIVPCSKSITA